MTLQHRFQSWIDRQSLRIQRRELEKSGGASLPSDLAIEFPQVALAIRAKAAECDGVVDVGAHKGMFSQAMQWLYGDVPCFCFEPITSLHEQLRTRLGANAKISALGLARESGKETFYEHHDPTMSSLKEANRDVIEEKFSWDRPDPAQEYTIQTITLDEAPSQFPEMAPSNIVLKLDTQGSELEILRGGKEFLTRVRACVVEHMFIDAYDTSYTFSELIEYMSAVGFECAGALTISRRPTHEVSSVDFLFVASAND